MNTKYNPSDLMSKKFIPGWVDASLYTRGVSALHEIGGHVRLRFTKPKLSKADHNSIVEQFETSFRQFYRIGTYSKKRHVRKANRKGLNVKLGDPKYLEGSAQPH
ncbi:MAG: hypothetical protein HN704_11080 [Bacteroidetes bacterium]|jgi:hypothetical protein|nr:hypothetical protein [Bacteroidota bacterium]MBT6685848.1 hypothetical protein [Bacteroidota bacterium]MBT7142583.1 hypothetical protein [Bacteroidota bacterium]MBT7492135.1 hypothetical protein [Bacteroidota bacterium]